jgi:hypothetical protein
LCDELAQAPRRYDLNAMRMSFIPLMAVAFIASANPARAQIPPAPGTSPVIPFPTAPPPPPPPPITVPQVPQTNSPPKFELQNTTPSLVEQDSPPKPIYKPERRRSFGNRIQRCLDEGAAMGLGPNERAAYSRICATQ